MLHLLLAGSLLIFGQSRTQPGAVVQIDLRLVAPPRQQPATKPERAAPAPAAKPASKTSSIRPAKPLVKPPPKPAPVVNTPTPRPTPEPVAVARVLAVAQPAAPLAPEVKQLPAPAAPTIPTSEPAAKPEVATPPPAPGEQDRSARFNDIRDRVQAALRYPLMARRQGWSGVVKVEFTILPTGDIRNLRLLQSSGYPVLDKQALRAVRLAAPFPAPPAVTTITLPVNFQLD